MVNDHNFAISYARLKNGYMEFIFFIKVLAQKLDANLTGYIISSRDKLGFYHDPRIRTAPF
jgi:hypothetical protein